jgi:CheY-like chemotaxis protein
LANVTQRKGRGRILVVDDNDDVREMLSELLEFDGFHVTQAEDAAQALAILGRDQSIDVMVTDLTMPGDDGIALIRQARVINSHLPAILLTGYAEQANTVSAIAGNDVLVLCKPVESERLIEALDLLIKMLPNA